MLKAFKKYSILKIPALRSAFATVVLIMERGVLIVQIKHRSSVVGVCEVPKRENSIEVIAPKGENPNKRKGNNKSRKSIDRYQKWLNIYINCNQKLCSVVK